jgi:hypothetical protein
MLQQVADFIKALEKIQGNIPDTEFVDQNLRGIASRQRYAAYKNGMRNVSSDFIDAVIVIYPELHVLATLAKDGIGKEVIRKARKESAK